MHNYIQCKNFTWLVIYSCWKRHCTAKIWLTVDSRGIDLSDMRRRNTWLPLCCCLRSKRKEVWPCRNGSGIDGVARPAANSLLFSRLCSYFAFAKKRIERSVVRYGIYSQYANCISAFSTFGLARNARRPVTNRVKSDAIWHWFHKRELFMQ